MRKLKPQVQMSVDGFIGGPNGEMDWLTFDWDEALKSHVGDLTESIDLILLGSKLAEGFIPHWAAVAANPADESYAAGKMFTDTPKALFSTTATESKWANTTLIGEASAGNINALKSKPGGDMIAYGGATFVSRLITQGLIDEYHLFINPVALGNGLPIFKGLEEKLRLKLVSSRAFECGIIAQVYHPA